MNNLDIAGLARDAERVFLPNRYTEPMERAYEQLTGEEVPQPSNRRLKVVSGSRIYMWTRGRDIPNIIRAMLANNSDARVIGITGSEWCDETLGPEDTDMAWRPIGSRLGDVALLTTPAGLDLARARLASDTNPLPVATSYPNLVQRSELNIYPSLVISGGSEVLPDPDALGLSVVDLVSTGQSMAANGLVISECLTEARVALVTKNPAVEEGVK